jgi:predicted DNA binding protein
MSVEAVFELSSDELLFGSLVEACPTLSFEIERVVPVGEQVMPFLWVFGAGADRFETAADEAAHVETVRALDTFEQSGLYRIEWAPDTEQFVTGILDTGGAVVEARGSDEWQFRVRFEDNDALSAFRAHCRAHDIGCQLRQVYAITEGADPNREFGLTDAQYEAVTAAVDGGYFEVPREMTFADLAADLGISQQAVSERVRRGVRKVLYRSLVT